jgi:Retroviral aspartyl protease
LTLRHHGEVVPVPWGMVFQGPLIKVTLGPPQEEMARTIAAGGIPKTITHNLLVDTGAQATCVEDTILQALGLVPIRFTQMMGVSGKSDECPVYLMSITLAMKEDGTGAVHGAVFAAPVVGTPSPAVPLNHIGLLGRDFLQFVRLAYDGPKGEFELTDYKHVSGRNVGARKTPHPANWRQIQRAKKRMAKQKGRKHRR